MNNRKADGGFTLPEVMVSILVVSAMMVGVYDAHKAMLTSQQRAREIAGAANQQALAISLAHSTINHAFADLAQPPITLEVELPTRLAAREWRPAMLVLKRSDTTVKSWTLRIGESAVFTLAQQVNTPPSCVFDAIARRCRR